MTKFHYFAAALLIMVGAASCKKNSDVQEPESVLQPSGEMRTVTVSAGQSGTKTSVTGGSLVWSAGDKMYIVPQSGTGFTPAGLDIQSGVGENSGTFKGDIDKSIKDDTALYGYAGGSWSYSDGSFTVNMPTSQTYVANGLAQDAFPSIGTGTVKDGVSLQNPFGILKLNVKGDGIAKTITVTSAAHNLAGSFSVNPSTSQVTSGGDSKTITLTCNDGVALSSEGVPFYVILPSATYTSGDISVIVKDADGEDLVVTAILNALEISAGGASAMAVSDPGIYGKCKASDYKQVTINGQVWMAENYACLKYGTDAVQNELEGMTTYKDSYGNIVIPTSSSKVYTPYYTAATDQSKWSSTEHSGNLTSEQIAKLGYLYNWAATVGVPVGDDKQSYTNKRQGLCPNGWHVPSAADFRVLTDYIEQQYEYDISSLNYILCTSSGWYEDTESNDVLEFSALPAGTAYGNVVGNVGDAAIFTLSSFDEDFDYARHFCIMADMSEFEAHLGDRCHSLRCLKD